MESNYRNVIYGISFPKISGHHTIWGIDISKPYFALVYRIGEVIFYTIRPTAYIQYYLLLNIIFSFLRICIISFMVSGTEQDTGIKDVGSYVTKHHSMAPDAPVYDSGCFSVNIAPLDSDSSRW